MLQTESREMMSLKKTVNFDFGYSGSIPDIEFNLFVILWFTSKYIDIVHLQRDL